MADLHPFSEFNFGAVEDRHNSSDKGTAGLIEVKEVQSSDAEGWGDSGGFDSFCSDFGFFADDSSEEGHLVSAHQEDQQQLSYLGCGPLDNLQFGMVSPPLQTCLRDIMKFDELPTTFDDEPTRVKNSFPLVSLEFLSNPGSGFKRLCGERKIQAINDFTVTSVGRKLSTEDALRIAGTRFIQSSSESSGLQPLISHPYDISFSGLSDEEKEDVELAETLLASAEKVGDYQFDRACKLLNHCDSLSSKIGKPVKRIVSYFSEALRERIDGETVSPKVTYKNQSFDVDEAMMTPNSAAIAVHAELPFAQVSQFTGVQAIIENVTEAKKIHIIDLAIRKGVQWTILMQALASRRECPLELLKITAVGTKGRQFIEDTGKRLMGFAQTLNIPFSFKIVMVSDMLNLKEVLFELDYEETTAIYSFFVLRSILAQPDQFETVMRVIRNINPIVMVVTEVEANHNSASFVNRFIEALFFFSAYFDCLETCMKRDDPNRMDVESLYFSYGIRNIVAAEGADRKIRHVKIDVWRTFFSRFGMVEAELSMSSKYQAELVAKRFACGSSCTFEMNGNCLLIGWKGTPLTSVSVWKFL